MSYVNKNADPKKIYSILDKPPVLNCGGAPDKEGNDTYWGKSLTKQSDEADANIQFILQKYEKTGMLSAAIRENPAYGDFSQVPSYHEAMNTVTKAHEQFMLLDAKIRKQFSNDPAEFLNFVHDPKNSDKLIEMGLATKPAEPISKAPATPPPAPSSASV